tara:strand:+ start:177 stop:830 length:654 start_codon:yes stop_codon:yes gene_type:complete
MSKFKDEEDHLEDCHENDTIEQAHMPTMAPDAGALRDSWLKGFTQRVRLGKTYTSSGGVLFEGQTAIEWLQDFKILGSHTKAYMLTAQQLSALYIKLAEKYGQAASFHANTTLAADALKDKLKGLQSGAIRKEIRRYAPGGDQWNETTKKPVGGKRPAASLIEAAAKASTTQVEDALRMLEREAKFFYHIMMSLETQRRCLKDFGELLALDPSTRNL